MKGSYVLLISLKESQPIFFGKHHCYDFKSGWYVYIGSAMNSLIPRIQRHLRTKKKFHWHIDYFLKYATISSVHYLESNIRKECDIAERFAQLFESIPGFGCSDCQCKSHLFYGSRKNLQDIITSLDMTEFKGKHLKH
jgi:Uri superfamily endonuclease